MKICYLYLIFLSIMCIKVDGASKGSVNKLEQFWGKISEENEASKEASSKQQGVFPSAPSWTQGEWHLMSQPKAAELPAAKNEEMNKEKEIKETIKEKHYSVSASKELINAINKNNVELAGQALRDKANPNTIDFGHAEFSGASVLCLAMLQQNNLELVKLLLDWNANPNDSMVIRSYEETPLTFAIANNIPNQISIIKMLIDGHADVNKSITFFAGEKLPIDLAVDYAMNLKERGREIVKLLLMNGAKPGNKYYDDSWLESANYWEKDAYQGYEDYQRQKVMQELSQVPELASMPPGILTASSGAKKEGLIESYL